MESTALVHMIFFLAVFGNLDTPVTATSSANQPLTCFEEAVKAVGRICASSSTTKKRNAQYFPYSPPPPPTGGIEEESDYSGIPGLAIPNGHQNPTEQHSVYNENVPGFQPQPQGYPNAVQYNNFRGQQPPGQHWQSPPQAMHQRIWPSLHPRARRMYSTGHQLAAKCCGQPACYVTELAAVHPSYYSNLCP